jgi:hypothetical protein
MPRSIKVAGSKTQLKSRCYAGLICNVHTFSAMPVTPLPSVMWVRRLQPQKARAPSQDTPLPTETRTRFWQSCRGRAAVRKVHMLIAWAKG